MREADRTGGRVFRGAALAGSTSTLGLILALASPAAAQQAPTPTPAQGVPASTTPASPGQGAPQQETGAQDPSAQDTVAPDAVADQDIVVTGFRSSLASALDAKRQETAAVDSIVAEDIGKFPDSNLAESMQRIAGVSLQRGDGGEGRNISVRGLGAAFTRVRINGMEGTSQTGSSDIYGAGNSGRSFDFNVFPTEIFQSLSVRKTPSADVEEGSLGATVDLRAPHPLDYKTDFVVAVTARGVSNELNDRFDPRVSALVSKQFADGTFGILASGAYNRRTIREVGYSAVDILSSTLGGNQLNQPVPGTNPVQNVALPFCTPVGGVTIGGVNYVSPSPVGQASKGATAANCSTGNPRTGTLAAYNTILALRSPAAPNVPGSGAFFPRLPRYVNSNQQQERIAGTISLQWKPDDRTDVSIDGLYSRFDVTRRDSYIAGLSFGRNVNNNGQPMVSVRDVAFDANGSLTYGLFDGVDVRSESLRDHFVSTFKQANLNFEHRFSDRFVVRGMAGYSNSLWDGRERLQTFMDVIDADGFAIDFRDGKTTPSITYGFDVNNPASYSYAPPLADGTVLGGFSFQGKPSRNETENQTYELDGTFDVVDGFSVKVGGQFRQSDYSAFNAAPFTSSLTVRPLPAGTTLASITEEISGLDNLFGRGAPASWVVIDPQKWKQAFNYPASFSFCTDASCGSGTARVRERITSGYAMVNFKTEALGLPVRGDAGVRYVHTDQLSVGFLARPLASSPTGVTGLRNEVERSYDNWLPSVNVAVDLTPQLLLRLASSSVISRPELGPLIPSSAAITATTRNGSANNPFLNPIRADSVDAALEWYFRPGSLLSVAYFRKNIDTFIQTQANQIPYNQLGLPNELLAGTNSSPDDVFTIRQPTNTPGGPLEGFEVNFQTPLRFLPGPLGNLGVLSSYVYVTSDIDYILTSGAIFTAPLTGLSKHGASGTLYYEDDRFSVRGTANYRSSFLRGIIGANGNDAQGNASTLFVDASAYYNITDNIRFIVEATNLTDERNTLYVDRTRKDTLFETRIGRTYNVGVNFKF